MSYYESPSASYGKSFGSGSDELALEALPKLRSDLIIRQQTQKHESFYIIKDPLIQAYYKFTPSEWEIFALIDGNHTDAEIVVEYNKTHPLEFIDEETVQAYQQSLKSINLLQTSAKEKNLMLLERLKEQRKAVAEGDQSFFQMTFSAWDPDKRMNKIIPHIRFFWTKGFFIFSAICVVLGLTVTFLRWNEFMHGLIKNYTFTEKSFWQILVFLFLLTLTGTIHELAHGFTLKNFGGEVHQMGFMLFYVSLAFFCDVSDSYILQNQRHRRWVIFAGGYTELFVCSLASFVWFFSPPDSFIYNMSFQVVLFTGISSWLLNMNPLIKLDGYYLLMDFVGIPDLREESFEYLTRWIKKNIFRLQVEEQEEPTRRKRRIFILYGIFATLYTLTLYLLIIIMFRNIFLKTFRGFGYLLLLITIYLIFRKDLREGWSFARFFYLDKKEVVMKRNFLAGIGVAAGILLLLLLFIPTHIKVGSSFVLQPAQRIEVRAQSDGFYRQVFAHENDHVHAGQILARLGNPALSAQKANLDLQLQIVNRELSALQTSLAASEYQQKIRQQQQLMQTLEETERKLSNLTLKSGMYGTVLTPKLDERVGTYARRGELFCVIGDLRHVKVEMPVAEYDVNDVKPGQTVLVKMDSFPLKTFEGRVTRISSSISERIVGLQATFTRFTVDVLVDNAERRLVPGMVGDAKILAEKHSVAMRISRELTRWIRSKIW